MSADAPAALAALRTSFGGLSGMNIGGASMGPVTGHLVRGSTNVKINGRVATMTGQGRATCSDHSRQIPLTQYGAGGLQQQLWKIIHRLCRSAILFR